LCFSNVHIFSDTCVGSVCQVNLHETFRMTNLYAGGEVMDSAGLVDKKQNRQRVVTWMFARGRGSLSRMYSEISLQMELEQQHGCCSKKNQGEDVSKLAGQSCNHEARRKREIRIKQFSN